MNYRYFTTRSLSVPLMLILFSGLCLTQGQAKSKLKKDPPRDPGIYVISHLELADAAVFDIQLSEDPDRYTIELTGGEGKTVTRVDVSNPAKPRVVRQVQLPRACSTPA